jgi:methylmalonyl-CoA mutase N-terminal domain/subunit
MAAVLGGTQSLHTNSLDEAYALPSEHAVTIALRTQQVIAYESGIPDHPDPLGGSYYLEALTQEMENRANDYIRHIDEMGGMIPAVERGYPQTEIANASYEYQHEIETGQAKIAGVNAFTEEAEEPIELLQIDEFAQQHQLDKLAALKQRRDRTAVARCLQILQSAAKSTDNTMPFILDAVRAYCTVGEICDTFREVFGTYTETSVL